MTLPGRRLLTVARVLVSPRLVSGTLEPFVADWQREWVGASSSASRILSRIRGTCAFLVALMACLASDAAPTRMRRTTMKTLAVFTVIGVTVPLATTAAISLSTRFVVLYAAGMLAASVTLALVPIAMRLGIMTDRAAARRHLLRVGLVVTAAVIVLTNVVGPAIIRHDRQEAAARIRRARVMAARGGIREALRQLPTPVVTPDTLGMRRLFIGSLLSQAPPVATTELSRVRHHRAATAVLPMALVMLGWGLARHRPLASAARVGFWWAFTAAAVLASRSAAFSSLRAWYLPREIAEWLPVGLLLAVAIVLLTRRTETESRAPLHTAH